MMLLDMISKLYPNLPVVWSTLHTNDAKQSHCCQLASCQESLHSGNIFQHPTFFESADGSDDSMRERYDNSGRMRVSIWYTLLHRLCLISSITDLSYI